MLQQAGRFIPSRSIACAEPVEALTLLELPALSLSKQPRLATRELESSPPPNVPYSLALFLASPKKKGEKEGRLPAEHGSAQAGRSARGRFFRE